MRMKLAFPTSLGGGESGWPWPRSPHAAVRPTRGQFRAIPCKQSDRVPSGLKAAEITGSSCLIKGETGFPVAASHTRADLSLAAVETRPSGLNGGDHEPSCSCFMGTEETGLPVAASQTRAAVSICVSTRVPSGLKAAT